MWCKTHGKFQNAILYSFQTTISGPAGMFSNINKCYISNRILMEKYGS